MKCIPYFFYWKIRNKIIFFLEYSKYLWNFGQFILFIMKDNFFHEDMVNCLLISKINDNIYNQQWWLIGVEG